MTAILKVLVALILLPWSMIGLLAVVAMCMVMSGGSETGGQILTMLEQLFFN